MDLRNTRTLVLEADDTDTLRESIRRYFHQTYSIDEQLYDTLANDGAFYLRSEPLRHPLIFYLGHTAVFYINKLIVAKLLAANDRIEPRFESMFAIGVDEMSWDDLNDAHYDWPTVDEVKAYRQQVRSCVDRMITELPLELIGGKVTIGWQSPFWAVMMGIEHQRIHLETSSVIIRRLPIDQVRQLPLWDICPERRSGNLSDLEVPENELIDVPGGRVTLGKAKDHPLYGWDNEYGSHTANVAPFAASKYLVSCAEYLQFVEDGGYRKPKYWTDEGQRWLDYTKAEHPLFWITAEDNQECKYVRYRTMAQEIDMPWDWPVDVNYLEAKAFCNWLAEREGKSIRLPTEDEWVRLRDLHDIADQPYWDTAPGNINLEHWASSCPIDRFRFGDFYDVIGNVWQWTETPITGFEGFEIHPWYDDFSTPTFDTQHNLIKGGSWISTGNEATRDCRYAFRRHFFQHAGLRYIESDAPVNGPEDHRASASGTSQPVAQYESDTSVAQYCEAHYGPSYFDVPNFPEACVRAAVDLMQKHTGLMNPDGNNKLPMNRALDLGCAVGRSSFELARHFGYVTGLDFSARFIRIAHQMQTQGLTSYMLCEEGDIVSYHQRRLTDLGIEQEHVESVEFIQGDALNLNPRLAGYDLVLALNLIDRLSEPERLLSTIHERMSDTGVLVIASPYTWLEEYTPRSHWIGGYRKDGEPIRSLDALGQLLAPRFQMIDEPQDIEFVLRETSRKFQHGVSQLTAWQRR